MSELLRVEDLEQRFDLARSVLAKLSFNNGRLIKRERIVRAVNGVSFTLLRGQVFSLVGESGCGKSTVARTIIKLIEPKGGRIVFDGQDITHWMANRMLPLRRRMQMIFQDPYASLNPRQRIIDIIKEPMIFHGLAKAGREADDKAMALLQRVGLRPEQAGRYPHQFSGGQRQRIGIARALAVEPEFIIADEPVSALDVSIQAQILNLMMDLKDELGFSCLFIAHDLSVVRHISDGLAVMYLGTIVERATKMALFANPRHPYTEALFSAIPRLSGTRDGRRHLQGEIPSAIDLPSGCAFHCRCPLADEQCSTELPLEREIEQGHFIRCHHR